MDTNSGRFVDIEEAPKWAQTLHVGEIVKLKGVECEVVNINDRRAVLQIRSAEDRAQASLCEAIGFDPAERAPVNRSERRRLEKELGRRR